MPHSLFRIKESLRKQFADLANDFSQRLHGVSLELSSVEGPLEVLNYLLLAVLPLTKLSSFAGATRTSSEDTDANSQLEGHLGSRRKSRERVQRRKC